jgi:outer membrane protein OmpA-like peptidoglycan-associated protein
MKRTSLLLLIALFSSTLLLLAQFSIAQDTTQSTPTSSAPATGQQNQAQQNQAQQTQDQQNPPVEQTDKIPLFKVKVVGRTTKAVNYRHRGGSTAVDFKGTDRMPEASGRAKVEGKAGRLAISAEIAHLRPATSLGGQYLTYVLWAITPEGRAVNLGEMVPNDSGKSSIDVTTDLQAFGMIITAEPYFAVTHPSDIVVAENIVLTETKGFEQPIDTHFDTLEGGEYTIDITPDQLPSATAAPKTPLDLLEARNAVAIAKAAGAEQYAGSSLAKATDMLARAEDYLARKQGRTPIGTAARGATQQAEDARILTLRLKEKERVEAERRRMQDAQEKAEADARASALAEAQAKAQAEEDARKREKAESDRKAAEAAQALAEAQQAQAKLEQEKAQADADRARQAADDAIRQKEAMRARLLAQLNQVLQTRDTPRGLVVSMPDVLFDFNKYALKPEARERLARISGIVLAYPDLKLAIEGYTDSIGTDEYNQTLSEKRAQTVQAYLVGSGVAPDHVTAAGFGKDNPVADNTTAAGRKLNRRVEMVVSGDVIGTEVTPNANAVPAAPANQ